MIAKIRKKFSDHAWSFEGDSRHPSYVGVPLKADGERLTIWRTFRWDPFREIYMMKVVGTDDSREVTL